MKIAIRLFLAALLLGLFTSAASASAGTTFALYVKDKTSKADEAISHVPQVLLDNATFPIRLDGKTIICEFWIHTDGKDKTVIVVLRDPSLSTSGDAARTIFAGTFPYSEKKTQIFDSDAYTISFKLTPAGEAPDAGQ